MGTQQKMIEKKNLKNILNNRIFVPFNVFQFGSFLQLEDLQFCTYVIGLDQHQMEY
jgi:hypothetical protein